MASTETAGVGVSTADECDLGVHCMYERWVDGELWGPLFQALTELQRGSQLVSL